MKQRRPVAPPAGTFRQQGGRPQELFSEYFDFRRWPEKATMKVTRHELAVILERHHRAVELNRFWPRFWRWLRSAPGTKAAAPEPRTRTTTQQVVVPERPA